jgi:hypothetical protein
MEWQTLAQVPGATNRYSVLDTERELGVTIEGSLQVKLPKGGGQPGADLEVRFVTDHVYPLDPTWDGQGEPPAQIRARGERELREKLEEDAATKRDAFAKGEPLPAEAKG